MNEKITDQLTAILNGEANIDIEVDQTLYPKPDWAVDQIVRSSGLVEDIDDEGCGHPNRAWLKIHDDNGERGFGIHGCNGKCMGDDGKRLKEMIKIFKREREDKPTELFQELWDPELREKIRKQYGDE